MSSLKPNPWIEKLDVYEGGRSKAPGAARVIKLSSNESALGTSPLVLAAYRDAATTLHRYPDATSWDLKEAIGAAHGLDPARIVCGLGSDEILKLACRAYAGPDTEVIYSRYGFMMYPIAARSVGATPVEAADVNYSADVKAILDAVTARTRIVFLANPNNPTGTYLPRHEVERLAGGLPRHVLLVLDAAYAEYVDSDDYVAGHELVASFPNVLVTRTFSKIYGIAALRLGWGYGSAEVTETLERLRDPFNVPAPTQAAGIAAVRDQEWVARARNYNAIWRQQMTDAVSDLGLTVVPSATNFILIRFPEHDGVTAEAANAFLTKNGVLLRWLPKQGLSDCLRMTIGLEEENREVLRLLKSFLESGQQ